MFQLGIAWRVEVDTLNDGLFRKWETSLSCPQDKVKSYGRLSDFLISQILKKSYSTIISLTSMADHRQPGRLR